MSYKSFFAFWAVLLFTMCNLGDQKKLYKYPVLKYGINWKIFLNKLIINPCLHLYPWILVLMELN